MCFVSKMTVSRLKSAIYEPHLMKNWEGYFLNSYSPIKWLVCVINLLRARISLLRVCTAQAMWLPFWLYIDIYINIITFILAFSNQIESFHKLHIKPNKMDLTTQKWILVSDPLRNSDPNFGFFGLSMAALVHLYTFSMVKVVLLYYIPKKDINVPKLCPKIGRFYTKVT